MNKEVSYGVGHAYRKALSYLPDKAVRAVGHYLEKTGTSEKSVNEIRLRAFGPLTLTVSGRNVPLGVSLGAEALKEVFKRVCGGAVYAHREDVCHGFVTLDFGIRVGVCGHARYDGGVIVGVGDISSLVFRIPSGECSFARRLFDEWHRVGGGMLICSAAGEGKTTAIRSLARLMGSGVGARRTVVIDERCEFDPAGYPDSQVDVLSGYKRSLGVDIAIRTMSAQIIIVDEISSHKDAAAMLAAVGAGVTVIATVHARSLGDAMKREYVKELILGGLFDSVCVIKRVDSRFDFSLCKIDLDSLVN